MVEEGEDVPEMFTDPTFGYTGTWRLSTSNCTNPALQLFSFGPVTNDGLGIGYVLYCIECVVRRLSWQFDKVSLL